MLNSKSRKQKSLVAAAAITMLFSAAGQSEVVFQDSFESGGLDAKSGGSFWRSAVSTRVSAEKASDGDYAAKIQFRGNSNLRRDSNGYMKFHLGQELPDVWMRYDLFVPDNYEQRIPSDSRHENKGFVTLWGGHESNPFSSSALRSGVSFWPLAAKQSSAESAGDSYATANYSSNGKTMPHIGHDQPATVIDADESNGDAGKWMSVYINVKAADAGAKNGRIAVWRCAAPCGFSSLDESNALFVASDLGNSHSNVSGFDRGYLFGWAATGFDENTELYVDNVVIADSELDLVDGDKVAIDTAAPSTPALRFGEWKN